MFKQENIHPVPFLLLFISIAFIGCSRSVPPDLAVTTTTNAAAEPNAGIEVEIVQPTAIEGSIKATGKVLVTEDRIANIGPVHEGRIVNLYAGQGAFVKKGQRLADLESADIDEAEADYLKALADLGNAERTSAAEVKFAQATYDRTKLLYEKDDHAGKEPAASRARSRCGESRPDKFDRSGESSGLERPAPFVDTRLNGFGHRRAGKIDERRQAVFSLNSPISGTVVERNATIGATVGSDANLFKIIDISRVWIDANVFEKDLERVRIGQAVKVKVPAFPGSTFTGGSF